MSRIDYLLNCIEKGTMPDLTPETNEELRLMKLAKGICNGGGVSSWNDLTDKPFGETEKIDELLPHTTLNAVESGYGSGLAVISGLNGEVLSAKDRLRIVFDGTTYDCSKADVRYFGNAHLHNDNMEDNGLPFCLYFQFNVDYMEWDNVTLYTKTQGEHTVAVYVVESSIVTLDEKYIPDIISRIDHTHSWNDLEDKPFYSNSEVIVTWDGNTDGLVEGGADGGVRFYKVSDYIFDESMLEKYQMKLNDSTEYTFVFEDIQPVGSYLYVGSYVCFALQDGASGYFMNNNFSFPKAGVYLTKHNYFNNYVESIILKNAKQLDEQYIPDTIARQTEVDNLWQTISEMQEKMDTLEVGMN